MKKVFLASFSFLLANAIFAQNGNSEKFGIKGGLNYSTITKGDFNEGADPRTSYYIGFYGEVPLIRKVLSLQPEIIYSRQGFETNYTNLLGNNYKQEYRIDYINLPILAKIHIGKVFSVEAGPQFGFKINEKIKSENNSTLNNDVNSFDTALAGGVSFNIDDFLISARYTYSINEVIKNTDSKNSVFQIGIGFNF
ncbi:PorT family protein [Flavobacterium jejuense]|uniref:PorT family protein n=1 Tax=Flavobacterium jejuense TaxID=1544455 RepID=A0ABX0IRU7_9FLAO|nr:porin family protein [Flavobacterium jejuense]NHN25213.1 PorT family protein [Flavobacterium jejuense]